MSRPPVSVVLPLHRTAATLDEILERLGAACPPGTEYVFVDDRCPDGSGDLVLERWAHLPGRLLRLADNVGQHVAVQAGLRHARGERVVVIDADLQDAPEDAPRLLAALDAGDADVVCAGRRGHYANAAQERTARVYRQVARLLSHGRIPVDAGMFSAWHRTSVQRVIALEDHAAPLVPAAALARLRIATVPVDRHSRPRGRSATGSIRRVRIAVRGLVTLTPLHSWARRLQPVRRRPPAAEVVELGLVPHRFGAAVASGSEGAKDAMPKLRRTRPSGAKAIQQSHNERQIAYFTGRNLPRMDPVRRANTPYTQRHLDAVVEAGRIQPGDRVVDVGCGPGKYTIGLAARGFDTTGLDLTPGLVEQLREVAPGVAAVEGDLLDPPAHLLGSFDVVAGFFVLHHLTDIEAAFIGARRLARPGGRVVFIEPNAYFPGFYAQVTLTPGMSWKGDKGIVHMRAGKLRRSAERAGLRNARVTTFGAFPPALANRTWGRRLEAGLERVPAWDRAKAFVVLSGDA